MLSRKLHASIAAVLSAITIGCSDSTLPSEVAPTAIPGASFAGVGAPNTYTSWVDGEAFSLDTVALRLYRGNGQVLALNAEQSAMTLNMMRSLVLTDHDVEQLEEAYFERNGQCVIDNSCPEPMFVPDEPVSDPQVFDRVIILEDSAGVAFPGGSERRPVPPRTILRGSRPTGGISALSTGDLCYQTVDLAVTEIERYRANRGGFLQQMFSEGVSTSSGTVIDRWIPNTGAQAFYDVIAAHSYRHIQVNVLSWLWYTQGCNTRQYWVDHIVDEREPISGPITGGGLDPTLYRWRCEWELWGVSVDGGKTFHPVNVRVCGYVYTE